MPLRTRTTRSSLGPPLATSALPTGLARTALDKLGQWIVNDRFPPGEVMPTESALAATLGVSRATARDAIKVLSGKGLVRTARRYGTRITPVSAWNLLDADVIAWHDPDHPRMRRIFAETTELRSIVEPAAAALAATRATPEQGAVILAAAQAMHPELDFQALFLADCRFHLTILDATQNQVMRQLQPIILTILRVSYEFGVRPENAPVTREGHVRVAEAIARHDADGARDAMARMLERNEGLAQLYSQRPPP